MTSHTEWCAFGFEAPCGDSWWRRAVHGSPTWGHRCAWARYGRPHGAFRVAERVPGSTHGMHGSWSGVDESGEPVHGARRSGHREGLATNGPTVGMHGSSAPLHGSASGLHGSATGLHGYPVSLHRPRLG